MGYWDTFESRWEITADLVAETGLRVGAGGEASMPTATDLPVLKDARGHPFIPGSSLRGVLRSHIERIVRTLEPQAGNGRGACMVGVETCIPERTGGEEREANERGKAEQIWTRSCRVCRVFGNARLASRVRIADLPLIAIEAASFVEIRDGVAIDREKETVIHKYDFEAMPTGVRFRLSIVADNLDSVERGLLWLGLLEMQRGHIHLGGFKGRGLGRVTLENVDLRLVEASDRAALRAYLLEGTMPSVLEATADGWMESLMDELLNGGV